MTYSARYASGGGKMWAVLALVLSMLMLAAGCATSAPTAVAVVLGDNYEGSSKPLLNAETDAKDVHEALTELGYKSEASIGDLAMLTDETALNAWLDQVMGESGRADQLVFYFAGHGESRDGRNRILQHLGTDSDPSIGVELQFVLEALTRRARRVVMLIDACRDSGGGFEAENYANYTRSSEDSEFYILFSTRHTTQALDGPRTDDGKIARGNSPFAQAILKYLPVRSLSLSEFRVKVGEETVKLTKGEQTPEAYDSMGFLHLDPNYRPWFATP